MRILRDEQNQVQKLELFESEICEQLQLESEQVRQWSTLFTPDGTETHPQREREEPIFRVTREQLERWMQYAKILKTGMTVKQVQELDKRDRAAWKEGKKSAFVEMYSLLADECPQGITAHTMRSYCTVCLYQTRANKMLLSKELAKAAGIPAESAIRHIKYLQAVGLLSLSKGEDGNPRWDFAFIPKALTRYYPD